MVMATTLETGGWTLRLLPYRLLRKIDIEHRGRTWTYDPTPDGPADSL
jgi:hypothetical protein